MQNRGGDWLAQAQNDMLWALDTLEAGFFAQACFVAQQVAEKALKSIAFGRGADLVKGHSTLELAQALEINGPVREACQRLDQYYITPRYPDSVASGAPFAYFTEPQAREAVGFARVVLARAEGESTKAK